MKAIWKGALRFGLIHIPVSLYSATEERELKFVLLHKPDLSEIRYARICKEEEKEVPYKEIVKGYEIDGDMVVLTEEDFKQANLEKIKNIEIQAFVDEEEVDSIYYEKLYYLEPGKDADKPYNLLLEALKKSKKVAVAKFVLRNHERLAIIKSYEKLLVLNQIRLPNEIKKPEIQISYKEKIAEKELDMAVKLIDQLTGHFEPENFKDSYVQDLKKLIGQKAKGGKVRKKAIVSKPAKVHDIMLLLKQSIEREQVVNKPRKRKLG